MTAAVRNDWIFAESLFILRNHVLRRQKSLAIKPADLLLHLNKGVCVKGLDLIKYSSEYLLASAGWEWLWHSIDITLPEPGPHLPGDHQQVTRLPVLGWTLCYQVRGAQSTPCHHWKNAYSQEELVRFRAGTKQGLSAVLDVQPDLCWHISFQATGYSGGHFWWKWAIS